MQETRVQSLGWEYPLEKGMATPPVFLPGESHGGRSLVGYSPWGCKESDTTKRLHSLTQYQLGECHSPLSFCNDWLRYAATNSLVKTEVIACILLKYVVVIRVLTPSYSVSQGHGGRGEIITQ